MQGDRSASRTSEGCSAALGLRAGVLGHIGEGQGLRPSCRWSKDRSFTSEGGVVDGRAACDAIPCCCPEGVPPGRRGPGGPDARGPRRDRRGIATAEPGSELRRVLLYADAVDSVVNRPECASDAAKALVKACEFDGDHALHAAALGIRAETEVRSGDITAALHDTARATHPPRASRGPAGRVSGMISVAETYGTLSLGARRRDVRPGRGL